MDKIKKSLAKADSYQRSKRPLAFGYAVVKKFGDDQAGYQAALVTYYGFLSLFPLLLILTSVAGILSVRDPVLAKSLIESVSGYFPVIGKTLQQSVNASGKSGIALVIATLFSLYGARGIADAFRNAVNNIWHIPLSSRAAFPRSLLRSGGLILGGGGGLIAASAITGWTAAVGTGPLFKIASVAINILILYGVFLLIFRLSLPLSIAINKFKLSAIICAVGLAILQLIGATVLARITPTAYSALFATTIGLLAWIYLQAQVIMYATVIATVKDQKLWPRSLTGKKLTTSDKRIQKRLSR